MVAVLSIWEVHMIQMRRRALLLLVQQQNMFFVQLCLRINTKPRALGFTKLSYSGGFRKFSAGSFAAKKLKTFNFRLVYLISSKSVGQKCFGILYDTLLISIQLTTAATNSNAKKHNETVTIRRKRKLVPCGKSEH